MHNNFVLNIQKNKPISKLYFRVISNAVFHEENQKRNKIIIIIVIILSEKSG